MSPLQQPYDGLFKVLQRKEQHYVVDICGRHDTISLDRLKPTYSEQPKAASEMTTTPQLDSNAPALQLRSRSSSTGSTIWTSHPLAPTPSRFRSLEDHWEGSDVVNILYQTYHFTCLSYLTSFL